MGTERKESDNLEEHLSLPAKAAIRKYVLTIVSLPGAVISILMLLGGWLLNQHFNAVAEAGSERAHSRAIEKAYDRIHDLTIQATRASEQAARASERAKDLQTEAGALVADIKQNQELSESLKNQREIAKIVADDLSRRPGFAGSRWPDWELLYSRQRHLSSGFSRHEGNLKAIWMYQGKGTGYVQEARFGDSFIGVHNPSGRNPVANDWHGEVYLSVCCR